MGQDLGAGRRELRLGPRPLRRVLAWVREATWRLIALVIVVLVAVAAVGWLVSVLLDLPDAEIR